MTFLQKRATAQIAALVTVLIVMMLIAALVWSRWRIGVEGNVEAMQSLDQLRSISAYGETWTPAQNEKDQSVLALFLEDATTTVVDANLQTLIKTLGAQNAVDISRTSVSPPRLAGQLVWHDVTIDLTGTNATLVQFVQAIESARPALFIDRLQIQSNIQPGVPLQVEPIMSAQVTVSGATRAINPAKAP